MDALNANGKTQLFTNGKKDFLREKKKREEKKKKKKKEEKKQQQQETNKKWGTGAVQDKPFDELLMFIVGKDSALFSGL